MRASRVKVLEGFHVGKGLVAELAGVTSNSKTQKRDRASGGQPAPSEPFGRETLKVAEEVGFEPTQVEHFIFSTI